MRKLVFIIVLLALALPVAAQDSGWTCPEGFEGQQLNVFNWTTYIGLTTMDDFAAACGITYTYDNYDGDDALVSRLRQGNPGYDIVVPSDYMVPVMREEGLLQPLEIEKIPNFVNLSTDMQETAYDPDAEYAIPYLLGSWGVGYNVAAVANRLGEGVEFESWEQFFNYEGPVAWVDEPRAMLPIALLLLGFDPNSEDADEIEAAKQYLIEHSDNVIAIASDDGQELLVRGEVEMAVEYNGDIYQLNLDCACEDYNYIVPVEGSGYSSGFIAIPVGAQNPELARVFIDFILDPQNAANIANDTAYPTPNQAAIDAGLIQPELLESPILYPSEEAREHMFFLLYISEEAEQLYNDAWDEIKLAVARR